MERIDILSEAPLTTLDSLKGSLEGNYVAFQLGHLAPLDLQALPHSFQDVCNLEYVVSELVEVGSDASDGSRVAIEH
jgi:hypothetical protein